MDGALMDISDEEIRRLVEEAEAALEDLARTVSPKKLAALRRLLDKLKAD